ncbi:hypothetical protein Gpo141_00001290 [Globisporangium polare]
MAGSGAQLPSQQQQQQQKPIANDHIPLAFLLGSRAKHYAAPKKVAHSHTTSSSSSPPTSTRNSSAALSRRSPLLAQQQQHGRRRKNLELFAPEKHPREREEEARRVLAQALMASPQNNPDSAEKKPNSISLRSSAVSTTTLSPMEVLRESRDQVLHQVLELRQLEHEPSEEEDYEPQHRQRIADLQAACDGDEDARVTSFHGYQRVDQQASFLDVSGNASRIPVLSNLKAKEMHQNLLKKQSQARAKRVDELHAFLQRQQQYTKQQLHLVSLSSNPTSHKQVPRVDLGIDDGDEGGSQPEVHATVSIVNNLAAVKEQQLQEQALLHERVQEKKLVAQLTRQQKLAFHHQQKRTLGRVKGIKRPSFLATLQLDQNSASSRGGGTMANSDVTEACLLGGERFGHEQSELCLRKKDEEGSEHEREGERKLQRDTFLQSEGGLHFGGGFRSKASNKKIPAITQRTSHSIGGDATVKTMRHELQELLECGAVGVKQKR